MSQDAHAGAHPVERIGAAVFDGEAGGNDYSPDLYRPGRVVEPMGSADEASTGDARAHWIEHGWLSVRGVLSSDEIEEAKRAIDDLSAGVTPGFEGVMYERAVRENFNSLSVDQRIASIRKLSDFCRFDPRMDRLTRGENMRKVLDNIFRGDQIRMFQDMALLKPPFLGREKPWHQDHSFFDFPLGTQIVGVWIALDRATLANGCMQLLDGGHRAGPRNHFRRRDWQICDTEMQGKTSIAFPLSPGDALFFDGLIPHGTPANRTPDRRRALQFHYCPADARDAGKDSRLAIFGGEGKGATC